MSDLSVKSVRRIGVNFNTHGTGLIFAKPWPLLHTMIHLPTIGVLVAYLILHDVD